MPFICAFIGQGRMNLPFSPDDGEDVFGEKLKKIFSPGVIVWKQFLLKEAFYLPCTVLNRKHQIFHLLNYLIREAPIRMDIPETEKQNIQCMVLVRDQIKYSYFLQQQSKVILI
jgi:hypothetical protein